VLERKQRQQSDEIPLKRRTKETQSKIGYSRREKGKEIFS
jgi:hypothetical protein